MHYMDEIKEMLHKELEMIAKKGELSAGALETVHKLTDTIKNIDKIEMLEDDGYSGDGNWTARGVYDDDGVSYRGRKRDRMGRYSRDDGMEHTGGGYNYSRTGGKEHMINRLERMMEEAETPHEKEILRHCVKSLREA